MKHITALTLTTLLAATGLAQTAAAASSPVALDLTAGYDSEYYYRGLWFSNQNASYNIGASKTLSDTTTLNALAYYTSSNDRRSSYQELDIGASLAYDAGFATLTAGYTYFFFFDGYAGNGAGQTFASEFFVSAAKTVGPVNVTATYAYDLYIDAAYGEIAVDKSFEINDTTSLVLKAAAGYSFGGYYTAFDGNGYNIGTESVWTHVALTASLPIALSKTATLTPYVAYNMSGAGRTETNTANIGLGADDDQLFFGVALKAVF
ncbi:MAG: hypothetical protein NWR29_06090 [Opitutales bacterium]|jgi:hypothetical protein|nr:hypothetical protein [Opitutales bacterium]MDP4659757.1 hypothetical protein [Opitutales bacterium]MDP4776060.1 hypothetical protein [Opitutales bacterium]MDP4861345.1 hypothetical protein [Opitutales bacterium]MDP5019839.1 hypothetical protein [Opitutales bacterium]